MWPFKNKRQIYTFWDGSRKRTVDPLIIQRAFDTDPKFRVDVDLEMLEAGDVESLDTTLAAIRRAFSVNEWTEDQAGLTQMETLILYRDFCVYMITLKKNISPSPISPVSTEPTSEVSTTNASWVCGLTEIERQRDKRRECEEPSNQSCRPCSGEPELTSNGASI